MTVQELLSRVSSEELTEWIAFFQLQEEEMERDRRKGEARNREPDRAPAMGDPQSRADAISEARKAQGLDG